MFSVDLLFSDFKLLHMAGTYILAHAKRQNFETIQKLAMPIYKQSFMPTDWDVVLVWENEPAHEIIVFITQATSDGSGEPAHARSLARAFAVRTHEVMR